MEPSGLPGTLLPRRQSAVAGRLAGGSAIFPAIGAIGPQAARPWPVLWQAAAIHVPIRTLTRAEGTGPFARTGSAKAPEAAESPSFAVREQEVQRNGLARLPAGIQRAALAGWPVGMEEENGLPAGPGSGERWLFWRSGPAGAARNMAWDEVALESAAPHDPPLLRFYRWDGQAATYGRFQRREQVSLLTSLRPLVRRPTGGGLVLHRGDWTYSLLLPSSHPWCRLRAPESYRRLHQWIGRSLRSLDIDVSLAGEPVEEGPGRCFAGAERDDLIHQGRKVAGASQRRSRRGLLIQGSLQLPGEAAPLRERWEEALLATAGAAWSGYEPDAERIRLVEERERSQNRVAQGPPRGYAEGPPGLDSSVGRATD